MRGPFLEFATSLPKSPAKILVRLMIAEGPKHPDEFPQLLITPIFFSMIWTLLFQPHSDLDTDRFIEAHVEMVLDSIKVKYQ